MTTARTATDTVIMTTIDTIHAACVAAGMPQGGADVVAAKVRDDGMTMTRGERRNVMLYQAASAWEARVTSLGLRRGTKARMAQLEAYLQGVLAVLTSGRYMTHVEAEGLALMVACGRAEEVISAWAALYRAI